VRRNKSASVATRQRRVQPGTADPKGQPRRASARSQRLAPRGDLDLSGGGLDLGVRHAVLPVVDDPQLVPGFEGLVGSRVAAQAAVASAAELGLVAEEDLDGVGAGVDEGNGDGRGGACGLGLGLGGGGWRGRRGGGRRCGGRSRGRDAGLGHHGRRAAGVSAEHGASARDEAEGDDGEERGVSGVTHGMNLLWETDRALGSGRWLRRVVEQALCRSGSPQKTWLGGQDWVLRGSPWGRGSCRA